MTAHARLSCLTADRLAPGVERPDYDWQAQDIGIVHLGIGAFHRAHQAVYTEAAMAAGDRNWAIAGVSLRSPSVRDALAPQDGLYTVTQRAPSGEQAALIGAVREVVVAPEQREYVGALIASPSVQIVTLTVTEKAYFMAGGALDTDMVAATAGTIYHHFAHGLGERRARGSPGLSIVSCDNLANNGEVLAQGLSAWLDRAEPALRRWFEAECTCPSTMVDRIVPAVQPSSLAAVEAAIGLRDEGAVVTEPFRQWVIEDRFAGPRPRWEAGGAQLVRDVAPYEAAKLRMLNGAHSGLAYLGLLMGHIYVHEAIADPSIAVTVDRLMRDEAAVSLLPAPGQDLDRYAHGLTARFANAALPHRLAQIASDGSKKIPQRWLEPLASNAAQGRHCPATLRALAAWIAVMRDADLPFADPLAARIAMLWSESGKQGIVDALFGPQGLLASRWLPDNEDRQVLATQIDGWCP